jgi:hypothetical protein
VSSSLATQVHAILRWLGSDDPKFTFAGFASVAAETGTYRLQVTSSRASTPAS